MISYSKCSVFLLLRVILSLSYAISFAAKGDVKPLVVKAPFSGFHIMNVHVSILVVLTIIVKLYLGKTILRSVYLQRFIKQQRLSDRSK
jgi:hypothetical protein